MDTNSVAGLRASLAKVPYQARCELLKPTIKRLYIDERRHVTDVADIIKRDYGFSAQYVSKALELVLSLIFLGLIFPCRSLGKMDTNTISTKNGSCERIFRRPKKRP